MLVTTSICSNYLPKAMVLAKSLKESNPNAKMLVCLVEEEIPQFASEFEYFDEIVLAKDLGFENFRSYIFKHAIVEAATSVKGQLFRYMMDTYKDINKFVYLDPDIKVYNELIELDNALNNHEIVITPHLTIQEDIMDAVMDNELSALKHGVYNLGFLAVRRGAESRRFIDWWTDRLAMFCYDAIPQGIFTDQRWIDLAPGFFDVHILKHPGYNTAPWNLSKRNVTKSEKGELLVNGEKLIFFHFSGFDSGANEAMINKYVPNLNDIVYHVRDVYVEEMNNMGQDEHGKIKWVYNYFESGEKIENVSRIIFRDDLALKYKYPNPFKLDNQVLKKESENVSHPVFSVTTNDYYKVVELETEIANMRNSLRWRYADLLSKKFPTLLKLIRKYTVQSNRQ